MRSRLLDAKRKDAKTPEKAVMLAHKFLCYTVEATNTKEIRMMNAENVCVNQLIDAVQLSMANCYDNLVCADVEPDLFRKLNFLKDAANALDVTESMFVALSDIRWVHLTNKKFIGKSIKELRETIHNWIRFVKTKIRRKQEHEALKTQSKN